MHSWANILHKHKLVLYIHSFISFLIYLELSLSCNNLNISVFLQKEKLLFIYFVIINHHNTWHDFDETRFSLFLPAVTFWTISMANLQNMCVNIIKHSNEYMYEHCQIEVKNIIICLSRHCTQYLDIKSE